MELWFKDNNGTYSVDKYSSKGVSKANGATEGSINGWNKLNEEAITEGSIGSINDINSQIDKLAELMNKQKSKLQSLISSSAALSSTSCSGDGILCNVPSVLSSFSSSEIEVLQGEIEMIESTIIFLGCLKTYLGFKKEDNMYYKTK